MGNFTNTTYRTTVDSLVTGLQNRLNNPYYKFSDKKPTTVTYWNINTKKSTLDQGSKTTYDQLGEKSPLRYNKINNFQLYGIPRFIVDLNLEEYGIESSPLQGEALILPNTLIPFPDDYFTITYAKDKSLLFRVNKVSNDTIESGANFYKIDFVLDNTREDYLESLNNHQLVKEYEYIPSNAGSNFVALLESSDAQLISKLDSIYSTLKSYYMNLFYRRNVQAFIYGYLDMFIYDPYLTEFIIRNRLYVTDDESYLYVSQAVHIPSTFAIEYDHTIFRDVENKEPLLHTNSCYPVPVHDPNSLLVDRMEDYFELSINLHHSLQHPINWLDNDLFDRIQNNLPYDEDDIKNPIYRNIIINYMNNEDFSVNDVEIDNLINLNYRYSKDLFYEIPILMYIIKDYAMSLQTDNTSSSTTDDDSKEYMEKCYAVRK